MGATYRKWSTTVLQSKTVAKRTACAHRIVAAMQTLFPNQGNADEYRRKLWDHLVIMSNFELDVDFPYEHVQAKTFDGAPTLCLPSVRVRCHIITTATSFRV